MKKSVLLFFLVVVTCHPTFAQLKNGDNLLGGSIGFWARGDVPMFGVNYENQVTQAGIGTIGLGGLFRYYAYNNGYPNGDNWKYSFTDLGFQANYNFNQIGNGSFVPFAGLVLGYEWVSGTYTSVDRHNVYINNVGYSTGAWIWAQLGFRYFFSPQVAGSLRLGLGNADFNTLELGVDFRF